MRTALRVLNSLAALFCFVLSIYFARGAKLELAMLFLAVGLLFELQIEVQKWGRS